MCLIRHTSTWCWWHRKDSSGRRRWIRHVRRRRIHEWRTTTLMCGLWRRQPSSTLQSSRRFGQWCPCVDVWHRNATRMSVRCWRSRHLGTRN